MTDSTITKEALEVALKMVLDEVLKHGIDLNEFESAIKNSAPDSRHRGGPSMVHPACLAIEAAKSAVLE